MTLCHPSPCCTHSIWPTIDCEYHLQEPVNYNIPQSGPWPTHPPAMLADTTYANTFHMVCAMTSVSFMDIAFFCLSVHIEITPWSCRITIYHCKVSSVKIYLSPTRVSQLHQPWMTPLPTPSSSNTGWYNLCKEFPFGLTACLTNTVAQQQSSLVNVIWAWYTTTKLLH